MNQLVTQQMSGDLATDVGETTEVSWTAPANMTFEKYQQIGGTFQQIKKSLAWWLGDWMNEGEKRFEDMYVQAIEESGKAMETLIKWKAVSARIAKDIRQPDLSWTHHFYVAYVEIEHRGPLLVLALNMGLSSRELKEVTKLELTLRDDLMTAAEEGLEHDAFMALVNKFKLGTIDKPKKEKAAASDDDDEDDEDEKIPFSDLDLDEDDDSDVIEAEEVSDGLDCESVSDYWENRGVALTFCGPDQAIWEGLAVRPAMNSQGHLILIWEEVP